MSVQGVLHSHLEMGYSAKHTHISDKPYLYLLQMQARMPVVVVMIMAVIVITKRDFTIPSCSSMNGGKESRVKMCWPIVARSWAAACVL